VILAAGLLVLVGLGLFVAGLATGTAMLYWATVAVCALAAVLLVLSRRSLSAGAEPERRPADATGSAPSEPATWELSAVRDAAAATEPEAAVPAEDRVPVPPRGAPGREPVGEPPVEDVVVTDLMLVVDLKDEVFVIDEHPRYHLVDCARLAGQTAIPLPLDEARTDGFTPCGICEPDRTMAELERARRRS